MFVVALVLAVIAPLAVALEYTPAALADKIIRLPGTDSLNIPFNQFSGYLQIPGANGNSKNIHYWLVESENSPSTDPINFWTNGGPGCSGLLGFFTEQGPFRPNADGTLSLNEFAWNTVSNMVFIESPAGVGFSFSDSKEDLTNGDEQTSLDNYNLIQAFLDRFPSFRSNDLYISSESYGGHYIPTLAKQIVDQNTLGKNPRLNFKGFAVGNPYTNVYSGTPAMIDTYWGHQIVPKTLYDNYDKACNGIKKNDILCLKYTAQISSSVGELNPYALDYPICVSSSATPKTTRFGHAQRLWLLNSMLEGRGYGAKEKALFGLQSLDNYEPCAEDYTDSYLNNPLVKEAIHVNKTLHWTACSYKLKYNHSDSEVSTAPIYNYLVDGGYKLNILVYSGDDDAVCGTIGTQDWIWTLGYEVSNSANWVPYIVNKQTAGFLTKFTNTKLAFLTVHGAGHEVPAYKPEVALDLYKKYLAGEFTDV